MKVPGDFKLERYFAEYEGRARRLLSSSDCESLGLEELLSYGDAEALAMWKNLRLGYTESMGHPVLRREIAKLYPGLGHEGVMVTAPAEGILLAFRAILGRGDHVIVTFPAYQSLYEVPLSLGCSVTRWRLRLRGGRWTCDPGFLETHIKANTRLVVVNFPHNPTGYTPLKEEFEAIVEIARRNGLFLLSDEMYRFLEHEETGPLPPAGLIYEKALSLSGLSKSFGLPGLRIGWLATRDGNLLDRCVKIKDYTTLCSNAPGEVLAIVALRARERIIGRNVELIRRNAEIAREFFERRIKGAVWVPPRAGTVALGRLLLSMPIDDFCSGFFTKKKAMLLPGTVFDLPGNFFRLGLGRRDFAEGLAELEEYLDEVSAETRTG